jgi:hypothetical protein
MHPIVRGYSFLCFFRDMLPTRSFMLFPWPSFCEERSTEVATGATSASRSGLFLPFPLVFSPGHPLLFFLPGRCVSPFSIFLSPFAVTDHLCVPGPAGRRAAIPQLCACRCVGSGPLVASVPVRKATLW